MKKKLHNFKQFLIAIDQLFNVLICVFLREQAYADESISSHSWRWDRDGVRHWPRKLIDGLFFWQKEHCKSAYEAEKKRLQAPPETR